MLKQISIGIITISSLLLLVLPSTVLASKGISPDQAMQMLKKGNDRFISGKSKHPRSTKQRLIQAGKENQGEHAYATVITCSDSRVPVERIFDAGVMDVFVIRVAGNVVDTDEAGSIEYGLAHVNTPVLVVLGHTQCGAVTAVTNAVQGRGHELERNIPPLVDNIEPAVLRAMEKYPGLKGKLVIPAGIEENVWQGIEDLFMVSPSSRELVKSGQARVVGAIYDVGSGKVKWLPESNVGQILTRVENNPNREMVAMAGGHSEPANSGGSYSSSHGGGHGEISSASHSGAAVSGDKVTLIDRRMMNELDAGRHRQSRIENVNLQSKSSSVGFIFLIAGVLVMIGCGIGFSRTRLFANLKIGGKLATGFGTVVTLVVILGVGSYYFMDVINTEYDAALGAIDLDMMASEISTLQGEYIVFGIEDNARGEKIVKEVNGLITQYSDDLTDMAAFNLSAQINSELDRIRGLVGRYDETFKEMVDSYHKVERDKEVLEELSHDMESQLAEVTKEHEAELDAIENARRIDVGQLKLQTNLVESLFEAEIRVAEVAGESAEFMLDKRIARIEPMERLLGELLGYLGTAKAIFPQLSNSQAEQAADRQRMQRLEDEVHEYIEALSEVVVAELQVEVNQVDAREEMTGIETLAGGIATYLDGEAESAKEQANMLMIVMMLLAAAVGTVIAFFVTRSITA
ncbi:MAG: hypothetical protein C0623_03525, partial [Desulfuromonas sp.]